MSETEQEKNCINCKHLEHPETVKQYNKTFVHKGAIGSYCLLHKHYIDCTYCTQFEEVQPIHTIKEN